MFIASRPDGLRYIPAFIATVMVVLGAVPIHVSAAVNNMDASAIAALDAIPAGDWVKQTSGGLLDRVIAASSKESLDAAAAKDPRAQALVGSAHLSGLHGYAKSDAEAVKFYRLAADSNPIAQNNLGSLLLSGVANGGKPAPAEAAEMFRRAAKLGHPVAQANLGRLYADGVGVAKDVAKAKEFLALAAAQGNAEAKTSLDALESRGAAESEAERWKRLELAAATDDANALRKLAEAYEAIDKKAFEEIKSNQLQAAVNTIMKAPDRKRLRFVERADEHGMTALHWAVSHRNASAVRWLLDKQPELELKDDQGRTPLKIAFDNLDTRCMTLLIDRGANTSTVLPGHEERLRSFKKNSEIVDFMLNTFGLSYYEGKGVAKDQARSAEVFAIGCEAGGARTCHNLGIQNSRGEGLPKDIAKAVTLFEKACAGGYAQACTNAGYYYFLGDGLPKDTAKAARFYEKGCAGDDSAGCHNLGLMLDTGKGIPSDKARAATLFAKACKLGEKQSCKPTVAAAPAATTAAPVAAAPATNCKLVNVVLGSDTVTSVERDIQRRGGTPSTGGTGSDGKFRMSALTGDYSDGGPAIMAVNYDFDAAGPAGRLVAVTIVNHANTGPGYEKLLASRKAAAAAIAGPLQQISATELVASAPGCQLRLLPNADTWFIHEVYQLPN